MFIRELDPPRVDADLKALLPVWREFTGRVFNDSFRWGTAQLRMDTGSSHVSDTLTLGAFADAAAAEAVGFAFVHLGRLENRDIGDALVLLRGDQEQDASGAAAVTLLAGLRRRLASLGRTRLSIILPADISAGYVPLRLSPPVSTSLCAVLDLAAVDPAQLDAWAEPSPANAGYRIVDWIGRCPDELAEAYVASQSAMNDAPHEDFDLESRRFSLDRLRAGEETNAKYGMQPHVVAAVADDGAVAGSCMLARFPDQPDNIGIWNTSVTRAHRGHGLGLRIKAESTRWLRGLYPEARWIYTFNNHSNDHMRNINSRMGYRHVRTWHTHITAIEAAAA